MTTKTKSHPLYKDPDFKEPPKKLSDEELAGINKRFWKSVTIRNETVNVYIIDGIFLRTFIYIDFCFGGHHYVVEQYSRFIPQGEIWLEELMPDHEKECVLVHEATEYELMHYEDMAYIHAHAKASVKEQAFRQKTYNKNYQTPTSGNMIQQYHKEMFKEV